MHFTGQGRAIRKRPEASVVVPPLDRTYTKFHACFTRGYISSQAYADKFTNAEIRPAGPKTPDFNTKPYQPQYVWLGAGARAELFAFLDDCRSDKSSKVNVWLAISPGSSTTKFSSRCDAAWALKCSPAKVHTGVHRILFPKRRIVQPAGDSVSGGPLVRGARPPHG
jgi:hypothetical protein